MSDISIIKPKARRTDTAAPTTAVLEDGEFAVNIPGKKIYVRDGATVVEIANADVSATGVGASGTWGISITGSAARWTNARTLTLAGVITGSASFDGSSNFSLSTSIADGALTIAKTSGLQAALDGKVNTTYTLTAGNGLSGGGTLAANRTITLGTPSTLSGSTTNAVTSTSHTHELSTNLKGWDGIDAHDIRALTNVGKVGSTSTSSARINTAEDWSALPTGYSSFMSSSIGTSRGAPVDNYGYFTKIASRDTGGGWTGLWVDHSGGRTVRVGQTSTSDVMPTWITLMSASWSLTAGNGLTGGGDGSANRTITLGTPSVVTSDTTNSVTTTSHTHEFRAEHLWPADDRTAPIRTTPDTYRMRALSVGFNTASNVGGNLSSVGGYYSTLTLAPWASFNSSHRQMQLLFPGDGHGLYYRRALDATTWDTPVKLLAHEDLVNINSENLLLNSSFDQEPIQTAWSVGSNVGTNYTITQVAPINKSGRGKAVRVEVTWAAGAAGRYMELNQTRTGLRPGQTYLASADIRAGGDATNVQLIVQSRNINGTLQTANHSPYPMDSVNRRGWVSRTLASDQDGMRVLIRFNIPAAAGSAWFEVDDVMLHASDTPTPWVPSLDDVQRNIQRMGVDASAGLIEDLEGASAYLGASTTGAIKIKIPNGFVNTMARMRVSLFSYASQRTAVEFIVGGYIYAGTGAGGLWVNHIATLMTGSTDLAPYSVRFGSEDGQPVIYIGELNTVWAYTHVVVSEFQAVVLGSPTLSDYERGWLVGTEKSAFGPTPSGVVYTTAPTAIATQLATARTIAVSGPVTGSASFNGTANVTLATSINLAHASVTGTLPAARLPTEAVRTDGSSVMSGPLQFSTGSVLRFNAATPAFFQGSDGSGDNALSFTRLASSSYLLTVFGTLTSTGLSVTGDGNGLDLHSGARVYKRAGSGITLRRHSDAWDPQVENAAGTQRWDILHAGNVGSATPDNALAFSKIDGLQSTIDTINGEANVLPNGAFDDGTARWQTSGSSSQTTHVFDGTNDSGSGSGCIKWTDGLRLVHDEPISVKKGEVWIVKFDVKVNAAVTGSPESRIGLSTNMNAASWVGGMNQGNFILPLSTNWTTREYVMTPTVDAIGYLRFGVSSLSGGSGTEAWIDNVRLFRRGSLAEVAQQRLLIDELNAQVGPIPAAIEAKADKTTRILAGNGLQGGGTLGSDTTVRLGTPSTITNATTNTVMGESHTHALIVTKADVGLSNVVDVDVEALGLSANTQKHNIDGTSTSYDDRFGITTPGARFFYHSAGGAPPDAPWGAQAVGMHMGSPWMRGQIVMSNGMLFYRQGTAAVTGWKTVVDTARQVIAGNGLSGGGSFAADRTFTLGTPSTLSGSTTNAVTATSHTHELSANLSAWDAIAPTTKANVSALSDYVLKTWTVTAGNGLSGGGDAGSNRTVTLGTPSSLSGTTTNAVTATSHTHELSPNLKAWDAIGPGTAMVDRGHLTNTIDWNTLTSPGTYRTGWSNWGTTTNHPSSASQYGTLIVATSGLSTTQIYYPHSNTQGIWTRTKWNAADWSVWVRMWNSVDFDPATFMSTSWNLTAGNGLSGGGSGAANRTITLGTPSTLSGSTTNAVTATSHTHALSANLTAWDALDPSAKMDTGAWGLGGTPHNTFDWHDDSRANQFVAGNINGPAGSTNHFGLRFFLNNSTLYGANLAFRNNKAFFKTAENGTWGAWREFHHSGNQIALGTTAHAARAAIGAVAYSSGPTPHANPNAGDEWTDTTTGITYRYFNDGNSLQWVELTSASGGGLTSAEIQESFETISRNLKCYPAALNYTGDRLTSTVYTVPAGGSITKTFSYTDDRLMAVILSGNTPGGIALTKAFTYSGDTLTGIVYS